VLLVDDVLTRRATCVEPADRVLAQFPDLPVAVFAITRTLSEFTNTYDPSRRHDLRLRRGRNRARGITSRAIRAPRRPSDSSDASGSVSLTDPEQPVTLSSPYPACCQQYELPAFARREHCVPFCVVA